MTNDNDNGNTSRVTLLMDMYGDSAKIKPIIAHKRHGKAKLPLDHNM